MNGVCACEHPIDDHTDFPTHGAEVRFCNVENCMCGLIELATGFLKDEGWRIVKLEQCAFDAHGAKYRVEEEL